jgi:hypothetical protein
LKLPPMERTRSSIPESPKPVPSLADEKPTPLSAMPMSTTPPLTEDAA